MSIHSEVRLGFVYFYLCLSLNLLNVDNLLRKKDLNLPVFGHKIKTSPRIKKLRHSSLHRDVFYRS